MPIERYSKCVTLKDLSILDAQLLQLLGNHTPNIGRQFVQHEPNIRIQIQN